MGFGRKINAAKKIVGNHGWVLGSGKTAPERDSEKTYQRMPGGGRPPMDPRRALETIAVRGFVPRIRGGGN